MAFAGMAIVLDVNLEEPEVLRQEQEWQARYGGETV
jgi:hypothetical protein